MTLGHVTMVRCIAACRPERNHPVRRSFAWLTVNIFALATGMLALGGVSAEAQAAIPRTEYPSSSSVAVSPPTIDQQVQQARARLHAGINSAHAGTAEKLTHPDQDRAGSSMLKQLT